eukprot:222392_1
MYRHCTKKEKIADSCLMLCVAIAKYTKESGIPSCDDVAHDITTYTKTFQKNPNYKVLCNDPTQMYTKQTLTQYLSQCFSNHLYNTSTGRIHYNALIITISGHCTDNSVICSDGETIAFTQILSIFTNKWQNKSLIVNLPKFIIVDGQRGFDYLSHPLFHHDNDDSKDGLARIEAQMIDEEIMNTYSAIMCSVSASPDSPAYAGQLCWNLSHVFNENMTLKRGLVFDDVVKGVKQRLYTAAHNSFQFCVDFIEHDMDIDDVVFAVPLPKPKGFELKRSKSLSFLTSKKKEKKVKKAKRKKDKKSASANPLSPRPRGLLILRKQPSTRVFANTISRDPLFRDTLEWDKSIQILSQTKDKTRVKVEWAFIIDDETHSVCLVHSQKTDPYVKAKRVLFINGKRIWNQKSTATQFTERFEGHVMTLSIRYSHDVNAYHYELKIDNRTHKQLFQN